MAEAGIGIADALLLIGPSVSRGRRTENMPLSCDMTGVCVVVCGVVSSRRCVSCGGIVCKLDQRVGEERESKQTRC